MKTIKNMASPFIMMMVPVFLILGILFAAGKAELSTENTKATVSIPAPSLKASSFKAMVQSVF